MNTDIITGDTVLVIAGKAKGKTGKITARDTKNGRVTVEGVNIVVKHRKPRSQKDRGGIKREEAAIDASNVMLVCPSCNKATRVSHTVDEQGKKHRVCKKCGAIIDAKKVKVQKAEKKEQKTEQVSNVEKTKVEKSNASKKPVKDMRKSSEAGAAKKGATRRTSPAANKTVG